MVSKFHLPDAFLLRFKKIDKDHQGLVDVINRCDDALSSNSFNKFEEEIKTFYPLIASHFRYEEALMSAVDYDDLETHRDHHLAALVNLREMCKSNRDSIETKRHILISMFDKIIMDIAKADMMFDEFLIENDYKLAKR